jgi:hypothetical protein
MKRSDILVENTLPGRWRACCEAVEHTEPAARKIARRKGFPLPAEMLMMASCYPHGGRDAS